MKNLPLEGTYCMMIRTKMKMVTGDKILSGLYLYFSLYYIVAMGFFIYLIVTTLYLRFFPDLILLMFIPFFPIGSWYYLNEFTKYHNISIGKNKCKNCKKRIWGRYHYITDQYGRAFKQTLPNSIRLGFVAKICKTCYQLKKLRE